MPQCQTNVCLCQKIPTVALLKQIVNKQKNGICKVQNWWDILSKIQQLLFKSCQTKWFFKNVNNINGRKKKNPKFFETIDTLKILRDDNT